MSKQLWSAAIAIALPLGSVGLLAQQPTSSSASTAAPQRVTVSGCIERADQVMSRANSADVDSLDFMLIKVERRDGGAAAAGASPHGDVPGKPPAGGVGATYRLRGETDKINPHVGHQVEISGTVTPGTDNAGAPAAAAPVGTSGSATAPVAPNSAQAAPVLTVSEMKLLSETCPRSER